MSISARDKFHQAVKNGLIKQGWLITNDPLTLEYGGVDLYVDLGAEKFIAAEKDKIKIGVEIKSFLRTSITTDFHLALGQLLNYRVILKRKEPERKPYLVVPVDIYNTFFKLEFTQSSVIDYQVNLIVYDPDKEEIRQWLN